MANKLAELIRLLDGELSAPTFVIQEVHEFIDQAHKGEAAHRENVGKGTDGQKSRIGLEYYLADVTHPKRNDQTSTDLLLFPLPRLNESERTFKVSKRLEPEKCQ